MHMTVDVSRDDDGRIEGTLVTSTGARHRFSGTLDLLRVLEALDLEDPRPDAEAPGTAP